MSETKRHLEARTTLYLLLKDAFAGHAIGSDQFLYWDATEPKKCLSPDVFVKRGSNDTIFDSWMVWERGAPELAVEIVSASDRRDHDWDEKMARYRASGIGEVVRFDATDKEQPIRVWDRIEGDLVERDPEGSHLTECATLGMWWVVAPSAFGPQIRLARDREGRDLLPTPDEDRIRLVTELAEERKAHALSEHERKLAEHERKLAEHERKLAEHERKLAEDALSTEALARRQAEEARQHEAEARQREAEARQREAEARVTAEHDRDAAERERDAALAELAKLRAELAGKPKKS